MCTLLFSYKNHPVYDLIMASNRDEYYTRPTAPLDFWTDIPDILAGRDLQNKGTWLGLTRTGRFAAITNFRKPSSLKDNAPSRGILVNDFLKGKDSPNQYLEKIKQIGAEFNGFNLLVGDKTHLFYYSNMEGQVKEIAAGFHGLSNHLINTPWTKVKDGKEELKKQIDNCEEIDIESIFNLLRDDTCPPDSELPETGVGVEWERILAPIFIKSEGYGTRASSIILIKKNGDVSYIERTFEPIDALSKKFKQNTRTFNFQIGQ